MILAKYTAQIAPAKKDSARALPLGSNQWRFLPKVLSNIGDFNLVHVENILACRKKLYTVSMRDKEQTRQEQFKDIFPNEKSFRWQQAEQNFFKPGKKDWSSVTNLPKEMREILEEEVPWVSYTDSQVLSGKRGDTYKALLTLEDGQKIETVLMENTRDQWTICVSSQIGCAMGCVFCATGKMGLTRNLTSDEIVDQLRFWQDFLEGKSSRISNVVFMGMGEPLANYDNVKTAIHTWLKHTDLGPTHITVSTVGVLPVLEKILTDPDWPDARIAISLHSADPDTRKEIIPSSFGEFIPKLKEWIQKYQKILGNRRHHLSFEYVMLRAINDSDHHAKALVELVKTLTPARHSFGQEFIKVNLIPYNFTDMDIECSTHAQIEHFKTILEEAGVPVTLRRTMGNDIAAACGQLIVLGAKQSR